MKLIFKTFQIVLLITLTLEFISIGNADEDLDRQHTALNIISEFADKICKDVPIKGTSNGTELTGSAKAELNGIVSKLVQLGIEGAAKYKDSSYEGPLQNDLAAILKENNDCRLKVWNGLNDKLVIKIRESEPIQIIDPPPDPPIHKWAKTCITSSIKGTGRCPINLPTEIGSVCFCNDATFGVVTGVAQ